MNCCRGRTEGKDEGEDICRQAPIDDITDLSKETYQGILHRNSLEIYRELIYTTGTYVRVNYFGVPSDKYTATHDDIKKYINDTNSIQAYVRKQLLDLVQETQAPPYLLNLSVKEAHNLRPADADGLSDPFCKVWTSDDPKTTQCTSTVHKSLNPKWTNESFSLKIVDLKECEAHVSVWDYDPAGFREALREIRHVKNFRGCLAFLGDLMDHFKFWSPSSVDDLLGQVSFKVAELSCEGVEETLELSIKKNGPKEGRVTISAHFTVTEQKDRENSIKRHMVLLKHCVSQEWIKKNDVFENSQQLDVLPSAATTFLFQHRVQSSIKECESEMCFWLVLYSLTKTKPLKYELHYNLLTNICRELEEASSNLYEVFLTTLQDFNSLCLDFLGDFCTVPLSKANREFAMRCALVCQKVQPSDTDFLGLLAAKALKWVEHEIEEFIAHIKQQESDILKCLLEIFERLNIFVEDIENISIGNINFVTLVLKQTWNLASIHLQPFIIENVQIITSEKMAIQITAMTVVLSMVSTLWKRIEKISATSKINGTLESYEMWMNKMEVGTLRKWLKFREGIIISKLKTYTKFDHISISPPETKISMTVTEFITNLDENLYSLWEKISWPSESFNFIFLHILHNCCTEYVTLVEKALVDSPTNSEKGKRFEKAIATNSLWHLLVFVRRVFEENKRVLAHALNTLAILENKCKELYEILIMDGKRKIEDDIIVIASIWNREKRLYMIEEFEDFLRLFVWKELRETFVDGLFFIVRMDMIKHLTNIIDFCRQGCETEKLLCSQICYSVCVGRIIDADLSILLRTAEDIIKQG